jgi:hypothetical protein
LGMLLVRNQSVKEFCWGFSSLLGCEKTVNGSTHRNIKILWQKIRTKTCIACSTKSIVS